MVERAVGAPCSQLQLPTVDRGLKTSREKFQKQAIPEFKVRVPKWHDAISCCPTRPRPARALSLCAGPPHCARSCLGHSGATTLSWDHSVRVQVTFTLFHNGPEAMHITFITITVITTVHLSLCKTSPRACTGRELSASGSVGSTVSGTYGALGHIR